MSARREPRPFRPPWPINQFVLPRGLLGRVAGEAMSRFNHWIEARAIESLELPPDARVLEIGFGPGVGVRMLTERGARVAGIDPSQTMLDMASSRNRRALGEGTVDLRLGTASELPWEDASFDGVLSVNNVHLWSSLGSDLKEVHRVLAPGGRLAIAIYALIVPSSSPPFDEYLADALRASGLSDVDVRREWVTFAPALLARARA
ncbi:MAG: class I SAM-dependent methyltransferase [Actinomycetota bacterium]